MKYVAIGAGLAVSLTAVVVVVSFIGVAIVLKNGLDTGELEDFSA